MVKKNYKRACVCALFAAFGCTSMAGSLALVGSVRDTNKTVVAAPKLDTIISKSEDIVVVIQGERADTTVRDTTKKAQLSKGYSDFEYSARINRFHRPSGYSYYDDCYTNMYWYTHDPYWWGSSIVSFGWPYYYPYGYWSVGFHVGMWDPFWYSVSWDPFWGWYSPYWGIGYGWPVYYGYYGSCYGYGRFSYGGGPWQQNTGGRPFDSRVAQRGAANTRLGSPGSSAPRPVRGGNVNGSEIGRRGGSYAVPERGQRNGATGIAVGRQSNSGAGRYVKPTAVQNLREAQLSGRSASNRAVYSRQDGSSRAIQGYVQPSHDVRSQGNASPYRVSRAVDNQRTGTMAVPSERGTIGRGSSSFRQPTSPSQSYRPSSERSSYGGSSRTSSSSRSSFGGGGGRSGGFSGGGSHSSSGGFSGGSRSSGGRR
ncbi:MAG: hypothetical protein IJV22_06055 [Bacteroidales bacterium]|nr:hypothetical protein [Bacteroidales bacterium]